MAEGSLENYRARRRAKTYRSRKGRKARFGTDAVVRPRHPSPRRTENMGPAAGTTGDHGRRRRRELARPRRVGTRRSLSHLCRKRSGGNPGARSCRQQVRRRGSSKRNMSPAGRTSQMHRPIVRLGSLIGASNDQPFVPVVPVVPSQIQSSLRWGRFGSA